MLRWPADNALNTLIRRYYAGEAGLWESIREQVDTELRSRQIVRGAYHIRLRGRDDGGYDIQIDDADAYATEQP